MSYFHIAFTETKNYSMSYLHSHEFYEFYFQISGTRRYFCDNQYYNVQEHSLVIIPPHTLHKFEVGPYVGSYKKIDVYFTADKLPADQATLLNSLAEKRVVCFPENEMNQIHRTLNKIQQSYNLDTNRDKHLLVSLWLGHLMHQIYFANTTEMQESLRLTNEELNKDSSPTILKIMDYIQMRYNTNVSLEDLCKEFHLSRAWISKLFFQANGITIFQYKTSLQLNKAKELLKFTTQSIDKIAKTTGFSSPNYFSKVFKKNTGSSPLEFRHAHRKQR